MPRDKELDYDEKIIIEFLKSKKMSIRQIAKEINRSKSVVGNYLKDPSKYGVSKRSERKRMLSPRNLRYIMKCQAMHLYRFQVLFMSLPSMFHQEQ